MDVFTLMPYAFIAVLGLSIGSFLNVLADRLSTGESMSGRSHCDHCKKTLQARDLVPVLSYFSARGKSRCCKKELSLLYPMVELVTAIVFVIAWYASSGIAMDFIFMAVFLSAIIVIFVADVKYHIIPDEMLIVLLIASFISPLMASNMVDSFISGAVLSGGMLVLLLLASAVLKKEAMGLGDVKLAFVMGWYLGVFDGLVALYIAFVFGGLVGFFLILFGGRGRGSMIAFGPFMLIGFLAVLYLSEYIDILVRIVLG